jgi:hypothetical protein
MRGARFAEIEFALELSKDFVVDGAFVAQAHGGAALDPQKFAGYA